MASIRAYIRTQSKSKQLVKVRFLLVDAKINLSYVSDILINPICWDSKKQEYNNSKQISASVRNEIDNQIQNIKYLILSFYNLETVKENLTSSLLTEFVNQKLQSNTVISIPGSTEVSNAPLVSVDSAIFGVINPIKQKTIPVKLAKNDTSILDAIDFSLEHNDISYKRKQTYLVFRYSIEKFIYWKKLTNKNYQLTLENITVDTLWELEKFFTNEVDLYKLNPKIKTIFPRYVEPSVRASNTVIGFMRILRAVFNFCIKHEKTENYPFRKFKMKEAVYGTPFYPTREELTILYNHTFDKKILNEQRDIYIFQCQVGMRINDFYQLSRHNINKGVLEYIPSKTKRFRVKTISIPLNSVAMEILDRYAANDRILPFISEQKYNQYLKEIFTLAGQTRPITLLDPLTNQDVTKPLNEIVHSHTARKFFCASLFEQVKDQSIVAELSGHSPTSVVFERYRKISTELKKSLTDNIF